MSVIGRCCCLYLMTFIFGLGLWGQASSRPEVEDLELKEEAGGRRWQLRWRSEPGSLYYVERNSGLDAFGWERVFSVVAQTELTQFTDERFYSGERIFWRLVSEDSDGNPVVSDIVAAAHFESGVSAAMLQVLVSAGASAVSGVIFIENGVALGNATAGPNNTWTFSLPWGTEPVTRSVLAEATANDGGRATSALYRFLLADPNHYLPTGADGAPQYGAFIPVGPDGRLGAFRYYPEGYGDPEQRTGAYFSFPEGAYLESVPQPVATSAGDPPADTRQASSLQVPAVRFASAIFHRHALDPTPYAIDSTNKVLRLDAIGPQDVANAFEMPPEAVTLSFGDHLLAWESGQMTRDGWQSLNLAPLGTALDFPAPLEGSYLYVGELGEMPSLVSFYSGSWSPAPGLTLEIPESFPLSFQSLPNGEYRAEGGLFARFPDGTQLRGMLRWQNQAFEVAFESENSVLRSLALLRERLPTASQLSPPSQADASTLEAFAKRLWNTREWAATFDSILRSQMPSSGGPAILSGQSVWGSSPAKLWALRLDSWSADYPGQRLTEAETMALAASLQAGARAVESGEDLLSILRFLRDVHVILANKNAAIDSAHFSTYLEGPLEQAQARAWARAKRQLMERALIRETSDLAAICALLEEIRQRRADADPAFQPNDADDVSSFANAYRELIDPALYSFTETGTVPHYLDALEVLEGLLRLNRLALNDPTQTAEDLRQPSPDIMAIEGQFTRSRNHLLPRQPSLELKLIELRARAIQFARLHAMGIPKASSFGTIDSVLVPAFEVSTAQLLSQLASLLPALPVQTAHDTLSPILGAVAALVESTTDAGTGIGIPALLASLEPLLARYEAAALEEMVNSPAVAFDQLALLARLELLLDANAEPRLFEADPSSGKTPFETWVDTQVSENDPATLFTSSRQALAMATWLGDFVQRAGTTTTTYGSSLSASAHLLAPLFQYLSGNYDTHITPLLTDLDAQNWSPSGQLQLSNFAGSAKLNLSDRLLYGHLSGDLRLPALDSSLTIQSLTFATDGRLDLTAYGQSRLQTDGNAPGPVVSIMPRRPLTLSLSPDGDMSLGGGVRLSLPDGNQLEGFFAIDDPEYAFGFAFAGSLTLKLAKELILIRPTIDTERAASFTNDTLLAAGRFFSSFNKGLETFAGNAPSLPDPGQIRLGVPPAFEAPVTSLPTDLFGAWLTGVGNATLHPLMQGAADVYAASVKTLLDALSNMDADLEAIRQETETDLAQLRRLREIIDLNEKAREAMGNLPPNDPDTQKFTQAVEDSSQKTVDLIREKLEGLPADVDPKIGRGAIRGFLEAAATNHEMGGSVQVDSDFLTSKMREWNADTLSKFGLAPDGSLTEPAKFEKLNSEEARGLIIYSMDDSADRAALGDESGTTVPLAVWEKLGTKLLEDVMQDLDDAIARNDLEGIALNSVRLSRVVDIFAMGLDFPDDFDLDVFVSKQETALAAIVANAGSVETGNKLAGELLETAARYVVLEEKRAQAFANRLLGVEDAKAASEEGSTAPSPQYEARQQLVDTTMEATQLSQTSIFSAFWTLLNRENAAPDPTLKAILLRITESVERNAVVLSSDAEALEQDLRGSLERLKELAEAIALLKRTLPSEPETPVLVEKLTNTWQALHVRWTVVAETQKAHWLVSEYMEHLFSLYTQYGTALGTALTEAFRLATEEAVLSLAAISDGLGGIVSAIGTETFAVKLPGDIEVQRLSGELAFNRETGAWQLAFGGKLGFPDVEASFEVPYGRIESTGDFSLSLKSILNAPFGLDPSFSLALSIPAPGGQPFTGRLPFATGVDAGGNPVFQSSILNGFSGSGILYQDLGDNAVASWSASVSYAHLDPGHRFGITTSTAERQALLSEEVLLFNGGFGFSLETDLDNSPTQSALSVQSDVGILLRPEARTKSIAERTPEDYFLYFSGGAEVAFDANTDTAQLTLFDGGTLRLPEGFSLEGASGEAEVALLSRLVIAIDPQGSSPLSFSDGAGGPARIAINDLGFALPLVDSARADSVVSAMDAPGGPDPATIPGFQAGISTILKLHGTEFPVLERISATVSFPHPSAPTDDTQRLSLIVSGQDWRIDGLPKAASINLGSDLHLVALDGFDLFLASGSGFGITRVPVGASERLRLQATGTVRASIDAELISTAESGDMVIGGGTSATFTWDFVDPPELQIGALSIAANMRLGGAVGVALGGVDSNGIPDSEELARLTLEGLPYLFNPSPQNPFAIEISGSLEIAGFLAFGLKNARFVFDGNPANNEPELIIGALGFQQGSDFLNLLNIEALPANLTAASIALVDTSRPPAERFALDNLVITASGNVNISLGEEDPSPRLYGAVENFQVRFPRSANGPVFNVNAFALTLENLTIGDLAGISGGLMVGNLNQPEDLYFAGLAGATFNEVGVKAIVAARLDGLIGLCLDVNAGPLGIPLDGGVLGGVLLTGATGGVSFSNTFADPCDFKSYLNLDSETGEPAPPPDRPPIGYLGIAGEPAPPPGGERLASMDSFPRVRSLPVIPWEDLNKDRTVKITANAPDPTRSVRMQPPAADLHEALLALECPTGDCPPSTINLLCQRHPSIGQTPGNENYNGAYAEDIIFKFSSLSKGDVDRLLQNFGIDPNGLTSQELATDFATAARSWVSGLIPRLPPTFPDAATLNADIDAHLDAFRTALGSFVLEVLNGLTGDQSLMDGLYEAAFAGIRCQDITIVLKGTFSWAPISTVLTVTGGATASTTGTSGITGQLNLSGIPVGVGEIYFSLTDANGQPNPSLCGFTRLGIGPLELGGSNFSYACDGCVTGVLAALGNFTTNLSGGLATAAEPILKAFIGNVLGVAPATVNSPIASYFGETGLLMPEEQFAVLAQILNLPELVQFYLDNPTFQAEFAIESLRALSDAAFTLLVDVSTALNPEIAFCADSEAKLFGISLTGGEPSSRVEAFVSREGFAGQYTFSPAHVMGNMLTQILPGATTAIAPPVDAAAVGLAIPAPAFDAVTLDLLRNDPPAYFAAQQEHLFSQTRMTMSYSYHPFGLKLFGGTGRILLPSVREHPTNPNRSGGYPYARPTYPNVGDIIAAAAALEKLGDSSWDGEGTELAALFPDDSAKASAAAAFDLREDYFPYGGFIGQANLAMPKPLTDAPPIEAIGSLFEDATPLEDRFNAAMAIANNYLAATTEVGYMQIYVPLPSIHPSLWDRPVDAATFSDALSEVDLATLSGAGASLYPVDQLYMRGRANLSFLGIPLVNALLEIDPAEGLFLIDAGIDPHSWVHDIVQANIRVVVAPPAYVEAYDPQSPEAQGDLSMSPEERLQAVADRLGATSAADTAAVAAFAAAMDDTLPKAYLEISAGLNMQTLLEEANLDGLIRFKTGAGLYAFSPRFEPDYATLGYTGTILYPDPAGKPAGPYTLARRNGGIVLIGSFDLGFNLADANPANRFVFTVSELSLGFAGTAGGVLPAFNARGIVPLINLPNVFSFNGQSASSTRIEDGIVTFNSNPPVGSGPNSDFMSVSGRISPIDLGPFLKVLPTASADGMLGGSLRVTNSGLLPSTALSIEPAVALLPLLGSDANDPTSLRGTISGIDGGNFTFSTVSGQPWSAKIEINGALRLKSPFEDPATAAILLQAAPLDNNGNLIPFFAEIEGTGLEAFELRIQIPNGITMELFPGTEHASTLTVGSGGGAQTVSCLLINSAGRIYYDSGTQIIEIASPLGGDPLAVVKGRLQFGFEPDWTAPVPTLSANSVDFGSLGGGRSSTRTVTVTNSANGSTQLILNASLSDSTHFEVTPSRHILGPGQAGEFVVRYTPASPALHGATLDISHNGASPALSIPLSGESPAAPAFHVTTTAITFPDTIIYQSVSRAVTFTNLGTAPLEISGITSSTSIFTHSFGQLGVTGTLTLAPGESRSLIIKAVPIGNIAVSGTLSMTTNDPAHPNPSISLDVQGRFRYWYKQREGRREHRFTDVAFFGERGYAVGSRGSFFDGFVGGRAWVRNAVKAAYTVNAITSDASGAAWAAGAIVDTSGSTVTSTSLVLRTVDAGITWTPMSSTTLARSAGSGTLTEWNASAIVPATGYITFAGSRNGNGMISVQTGSSSFQIAGLSPTVVPPLNGITFSAHTSAPVGIAVGDDGIILRSTNGGKNWTQVTNVPWEIDNIRLNGVAANPANSLHFVAVGDTGTIVTSSDAGLSWSIRTPQTTENLNDVVRSADANWVAVGDKGTVLRGNGLTGLWSEDPVLTEEDFTAITVSGEGTSGYGQSCWATTRQGGIFHRTTSFVFGSRPVLNINEDFTDPENDRGSGEKAVREIRYINDGTASATVGLGLVNFNAAEFTRINDVHLDLSNMTTSGSLNLAAGRAVNYGIVYATGNSGPKYVDMSFSTSDSVFVNQTLPTRINNIGRNAYTPLGYLAVGGSATLPNVLVGQTSQAFLPMKNIGEADLEIYSIEVDAEENSGVWEPILQSSTGTTLPASNTPVFIWLKFTPSKAGTFEATVRILNNSANPVASYKVTVQATAPPQQVRFESNIPGTLLQVDHDNNGTFTNYTLPAVFEVVTHAPTSSTQLQRGSTVIVGAYDTFTVDGVLYRFQNWQPGTGRTFEFSPGESADVFKVNYARSRIAGSAIGPVSTVQPVACGFSSPNDVPYGPWVRISEANLTLPWLDDADGTDFRVEGALFLTLQRVYGRLASSGIVMRVPDSAFVGKNMEFLEITPGAWSFDIDTMGKASFSSLTPGVQILNQSAVPPANLEIAVDLTASAASRRARVAFATLDDLTVIPGMMALGPGEVALELSLSSAAASLAFNMDGRLKLLADPLDNNAWLIDQSFDFAFHSSVGFSSYTFPSSGTLFDVGLFSLHSVGGLSSIGFVLANNSVLSVGVWDLEVGLFGNSDRLDVSQLVVGTDGSISFDTSLPTAGLDFGLMKLVPINATTAARRTSVRMQPLQAILQVSLPDLYLNSPQSAWPNSALTLPAVDIDTANFFYRFDMPSINLGGLLTQPSAANEANYIELSRVNGAFGLKFRNEVDLYIGAMSAFLDATPSGLAGQLSGRVGVESPSPLDLLQQSVTLQYNPNPATGRANFELSQRFFGIGVRLQVGGISPPARLCTLTTVSNTAIENWPTDSCFP